MSRGLSVSAILLLSFTQFLFASPHIPKSGIYKFKRETEIVPAVVLLNGVFDDNRTGASLTFSKDEPVAVEWDHAHNATITPLLSQEESAVVPEKIILAEEDFLTADLQFMAAGNETALRNKFSVFEVTQVASLHGGAIRARTHRRQPGNCVHYVLRRLGVDVRGNGKDMARALHDVGFSRVNCSHPPPGTVASWEGGWHGLGHTAIWNGRCFAYDRGCGDPGRSYHLTGCVHR